MDSLIAPAAGADLDTSYTMAKGLMDGELAWMIGGALKLFSLLYCRPLRQLPLLRMPQLRLSLLPLCLTLLLPPLLL